MNLNSNHISIRNIADKVGVSSATISLVLSGKTKEGRISKSVADKIQQAAIDMNYRPNMVARSLRTGETKTIGLIVTDISNPFFAKLARQIENIARLKGYQIMFSSSDDSSEKFEKLVGLFIEQNVDGIIAVPPDNSQPVIMQLIERRIPIVLVDRKVESVPVSSIIIDNFDLSLALTNHLIGQGCKRIAFITHNMGLPNIQEYYKGYQSALENNRISIDKELIYVFSLENIESDIKLCVNHLLKTNIDSIIFTSNSVGIQSLIELKRNKKKEMLKYASIDTYEEYKISDLSITCIDYPIKSMGQKALNILLKQIENKNHKTEIETISLRAKLFINKS